MSCGFCVQASSDVPDQLLEKYEIPTSPVIFKGSENSDRDGVEKHFMTALVRVSLKIEALLQTKILL